MPKHKPAPRKPLNGRAKLLSDFRPQCRNINLGKPHGMAGLHTSIRRNGYGSPMVAVADGEVIDGSKRREAVEEIFRDVSPIVVHSDGTRPIIHVRDDIPNADDPRAVELAYAANVVAAMNWNPDGELLAAAAADSAYIAELARQDNASVQAVAEYAATQEMADAEPQIDRAEELNKVWQVKRGDLWRVGEHRLLCGDSTVRADVERVMGGEIMGTLTDPPYGVDFAYDAASWDAASENDKITNAVIPALPHPLVYTPGKRHLLRELSRWDEEQVKLVAWHKKFSMTRNGLGGADVWEIVLVVDADSKLAHMPTNHIECMTDREPRLLDKHPCPKPVALFIQLAESLLGQSILDPFVGSGTTLIACENLHRRGRGIEISPAYCAVTLERMSTAFPGIEIERVAA